MKKLSVKLALRIAGLFIIFSIIIGVSFNIIYERQLINHFEESMVRDMSNITRLIRSNLKIVDDTVSFEQIESLKDEFSLCEQLTNTEIFVLDKSNKLINYKENDISGIKMSGIEKYIGYFNNGFKDENTLRRIKQDKEDYFYCGMMLVNINEDDAGMIILSTPVKYYNRIFENVIGILLLSIFIGICFVAVCTVHFSKSFVKPIEKIEDISMMMADGNYDITTGIESNDEIGNLAGAIEILAERLEEGRIESQRAEACKREFIAKISHELKTPVTVIRGTLDLMEGNQIKDKELMGYYIGEIKTEIILLQKMINELFDLTRLQTSEFQLNFTSFDFVELLGDVMMSAVILAKQKEIIVSCKEPEGEILINGDYDRLRQLLMIIIDNAVKYSPRGSKIELVVDVQAPSITVRDNGIGIEEKKLKNIFIPYYRAGESIKSEGTGLGLAIAAEIAKRHGFEIKAESEMGRGSEFTLSLFNSK